MELSRAIIITPRKNCPNCKVEKVHYSFTDDFQLIIQPITNQDWQCPKCEKEFCSNCFKVDHKGEGSTLFCPNCKEKLRFPNGAEYHPCELN